MGQRGAGWTDTSQDAMDSAAREHQERMAAKTAYLKVQIILEQVEQSMHALVENDILYLMLVLGGRHRDRIKG